MSRAEAARPRRPVVALVEDDAVLRMMFGEFVESEGFEVLPADSLSGLNGLLQRRTPDLLFLDLMLPEGNSLDALHALKRQGEFGIIIITSRGSQTDKVVGLELGADDYLVKPFDFREAVARCRSVLRRRSSHVMATHVRRIEGWTFDLLSRRLVNDTCEVSLTSREFEVLAALSERPGEILSRELLLSRLSGSWAADARAIDVIVGRLRRKMGDMAEAPRMIITVHGRGYQFGTRSG